MHEYIYQFDGKYYRELIDLCGKSVYCEEITEAEYLSYKNKPSERL